MHFVRASHTLSEAVEKKKRRLGFTALGTELAVTTDSSLVMLQEQRLRYIKKEKLLNTNTKSVSNVRVCLFVFQLSVITRAWHSLRLLHHITKCLHGLVKTVQKSCYINFPTNQIDYT